MQKIKEKFILWWKIYFGSMPISYGKFKEHFAPFIQTIGIPKKDLCEYRLTQVYDESTHEPTDEFYYSNKSLGSNTTYKPTTMKEFTNSYNLEFLCRDRNTGLFNKKTKTKTLIYLGKKKMIVNSPYMVEVKFGDVIAISNDLLMVIPRKIYKKLFR
jgi:hypothetical protein